MLMLFMTIEDPQDRSFMAQLYQGQRSHLLGIAAHSLQNLADAEDAVQEVFLKLLSHEAIQKLTRMSPEGRESYLIVCLLNQIRDMMRQKTARKETELREDFQDPNSEDWEEYLAEKDFLQHFLVSLNDKQRDMLLYRYKLDMSSRDIAALLKMTPEAVQKTLARLKKKMRTWEKEAQR